MAAGSLAAVRPDNQREPTAAERHPPEGIVETNACADETCTSQTLQSGVDGRGGAEAADGAGGAVAAAAAGAEAAAGAAGAGAAAGSAAASAAAAGSAPFAPAAGVGFLPV